MADSLDLHWEGWTVALLAAALWLAPLGKRWHEWRDCIGLILVAGATAVSAALHGALDHVDSAAIEAMAGLGAARLIVEARRQAKAYAKRHQPDTVVLCEHEEHDTQPYKRR